MRKRNAKWLFDNIFWYALYLLPVLLMLLFVGKESVTTFNIDSFVQSLGLQYTDNNIVYGVLKDLFGTNGILPLVDSVGVLSILAYYANILIVHLGVDTLLALPKLCHKFMDELE